MSDVPKRVPPIEKVRLRKLTTADGAAYVGVELEYRVDPDEPVRLAFGLTPGDAVELGTHLKQLGEKLESTEH